MVAGLVYTEPTLQTAAEGLDVVAELDIVKRTVRNIIASSTLWTNLAPIKVGPSTSTCSPPCQSYSQGEATHRYTSIPQRSTSTL